MLIDDKGLSLVFSHNISGETHPCGCRHFPLGGLPQVAGALKNISDKNKLIYVDTGDTFFPSSKLPQSLEKSFTYAANNLALGLEKLGLNFYLPGDQDFARGLKFLQVLANNSKFQFLLTNLKNEKLLKHKRFIHLKSGPSEIFLLGVVDPDILLGEEKNLFWPPEIGLSKVMPEIKKEGYDSKNPLHRLVVLSHSGINQDYELAKKFPYIDWIIGAHDQSFTKSPLLEGNTKVVQALSRNHYLGHIFFDFKGGKSKDHFELIKVGKNLGKKLNPNPFYEFIKSHKIKMRELQRLEQSEIIVTPSNLPPFDPPSSCIECHEKQGEHWKKTAHSLAYLTLIKQKEEKNLNCLSCHTMGLNKKRGHYKSQNLVNFKDPPMNKKNPLDERIRKRTPKEISDFKKTYWKEIEDSFQGIKSVRGLGKKEKLKSINTWLKIDQKYKITHNFTGVQCLNCHSLHLDHPFEETKIVDKKLKTKCLNCHNSYQSPNWYQVKSNGLPGNLDEKKFEKALRAISCPKGMN
ncbi:MAG: hypothetical protein DRQ88_12565 [Epsilonproteobacteria bacterium]|nr:MAG: hypothetical protein DRQ89_11345 [Campylobacterota bacterium]RLA63301.1 MAG: hypothetical protein DRQ88_12565 [Campylobacterota bacterium]